MTDLVETTAKRGGLKAKKFHILKRRWYFILKWSRYGLKLSWIIFSRWVTSAAIRYERVLASYCYWVICYV